MRQHWTPLTVWGRWWMPCTIKRRNCHEDCHLCDLFHFSFILKRNVLLLSFQLNAEHTKLIFYELTIYECNIIMHLSVYQAKYASTPVDCNFISNVIASWKKDVLYTKTGMLEPSNNSKTFHTLPTKDFSWVDLWINKCFMTKQLYCEHLFRICWTLLKIINSL